MRIDNLLLGSTKQDTLIFAEIRLREGKRENERTITPAVSFSEVAPFEASYDLLMNRVENLFYGDCELTEHFMNEYNCSEEDVPFEFYKDLTRSYGVEGIVDTSLFPESYSIEGYEDDIYFDSLACGQIDERDIIIPISEDIVKRVFGLWDKYHLEELQGQEMESVIEQFYTILGFIGNFDNNKWIREWLETNPHTIRLM